MPRRIKTDLVIEIERGVKVRVSNDQAKATMLASTRARDSAAKEISDLYVGKNGTYFVMHFAEYHENGVVAMPVVTYENALRIYNDYEHKFEPMPKPVPAAPGPEPVDA